MLLFFAFYSPVRMPILPKSSQITNLLIGKAILPKFLASFWEFRFFDMGIQKIADKSDKITGNVASCLINSIQMSKLQTFSCILLFTASKLKKVLKSYGYFCEWCFSILTLKFQFNGFHYSTQTSNETPVSYTHKKHKEEGQITKK